MAARGLSLNPSSVPFFPGGMGHVQEAHRTEANNPGQMADLDALESAAHRREFTSTTDYQSFRSSPSPPHMQRTDSPESSSASVSKADAFSSPQRVDMNRFRSPDSVTTPETSIVSSASEADIKAEITPIPTPDASGLPGMIGQDSTHVSSIFRTAGQVVQQEQPAPVHAFMGLRSSSTNYMIASSPASSAGDSRASAGLDYLQGFENQLRTSPLINDILDRLARCETSGREIRQELGEVHRKVELLLRTVQSVEQMRVPDRPPPGAEPMFRNAFASSAGTLPSAEPTFRNPFAPSAGTLPPSNGVGFPGSGVLAVTPSNRPQDEIAQISQRLNTLTSSVSQLLALQTQQHMQSVNSGLQPLAGSPSNPATLNDSISSIPGGLPAGPLVLSNRPDLRPPSRAPNPPMRTWSAGSLDLPMRPQDPNIGLGRPDSFLRDKRRSVAGLRRDSGSLVG